MALKDIFNMIKADRYTADGREQVIKAQEAETEDRTYQIGEISQKTGLQKTANGWVKPKKGGNKVLSEQSKPVESKSESRKSKTPESKAAEWETKGKYQVKKFEDEKTLNNFLKENGFVEEGYTTTSFSEKGAVHEEVYKKGNETLVKLTGPGINKPTIRKKIKASEDSAPRVLTGDTRIRVRK